MFVNGFSPNLGHTKLTASLSIIAVVKHWQLNPQAYSNAYSHLCVLAKLGMTDIPFLSD